jgi:hydrogenase maturation protease
MKIIACGNRERGDDGAGIIAAERLRALGIDAETCAGEASGLIELWSGVDDVIVIDAVVTGADAGTVHLWDARHPLTYSNASGSTHGLGVADAIELSRVLDCLPRKLLVYGIEGQNFEIGSEISPEVDRGIVEVVQRISAEVNAGC